MKIPIITKILCLVSSVVLVSCGGNGSQTGEQSNSSDKKTSLFQQNPLESCSPKKIYSPELPADWKAFLALAKDAHFALSEKAAETQKNIFRRVLVLY